MKNAERKWGAIITFRVIQETQGKTKSIQFSEYVKSISM